MIQGLKAEAYSIHFLFGKKFAGEADQVLAEDYENSGMFKDVKVDQFKVLAEDENPGFGTIKAYVKVSYDWVKVCF